MKKDGGHPTGVSVGEKGENVDARPRQQYRRGARPQPQGCGGSTEKEATEGASVTSREGDGKPGRRKMEPGSKAVDMWENWTLKQGS